MTKTWHHLSDNKLGEHVELPQHPHYQSFKALDQRVVIAILILCFQQCLQIVSYSQLKINSHKIK